MKWFFIRINLIFTDLSDTIDKFVCKVFVLISRAYKKKCFCDASSSGSEVHVLYHTVEKIRETGFVTN